MRILRSTLLAAVLIVAFAWQSIAQQYYPGIPVFVPATMAELNNQQWVTVSYGSFDNPTQTTGYTTSGNITHSIITTMTDDATNACYDGYPNLSLKTMPNTDILPDWDEARDGPLRVMRLGDNIFGSASPARTSSCVTYRFIPSDTENMLIVYFAFVAQNPSHHEYVENPHFKVEVLKQNDTYALTPASNSYFLVNPQGASVSPNPQAQPVPYNYCGQSNPGTQRQWCNWVPVAFNLGDTSNNGINDYRGRNVKLRITTRDCIYNAHYAYAYYAARGTNGVVTAMACGDDDVVLTVPEGFREYKWYCNGNRISGNSYRIERPRNIAETNFSCEMVAYTGATMTFTGEVDFYELEPDFEVGLPTNPDCSYRRQFNNTSTVSIVRPDETVTQTITYAKWNFGDGTPEVEAVSPTHIYENPDVYEVTLTLWDNEKKCMATITKEIDVTTLDTCKKDTTEFLCSEDFPNYYHPVHDKNFPSPGEYNFKIDEYCASGCPTILHLTLVDNLSHGEGYDTVYVCKESFPYTHSSGNVFNMPGTYPVLYEDGSENGCDSTLYLRIVEVAPKVAIAIDGVFCDEFTAELYAVSETEIASYLWSSGEITDRITITEPGQYNLTITDAQNCKAENLFKVPACVPNIILATAISPSDQNGINDYFHLPQVSLIESAEVMIYDRFGTLVFYSKDKNFKWDGTINGKLATHATYNYILFVTDYNGITTRHAGNLGVY